MRPAAARFEKRIAQVVLVHAFYRHLQITPAERFVYYYAHLDAWREGLRNGMTVARGEVLGYVGSTGNASANAPHLHFQAMRYRRDRYWDGEPVNPLPFLLMPGLPLTAITANGQR